MKTKRTNKILALVVAMIMIVSTFSVLAINAAALETLTVDETVQTYIYDGTPKVFAVTASDPTITDFTVTYTQGGSAVTDPTEIGEYDVTVERAEDATYSAFTATITGGLVIRALSVDDVNSALEDLKAVVDGIESDYVTSIDIEDLTALRTELDAAKTQIENLENAGYLTSSSTEITELISKMNNAESAITAIAEQIGDGTTSGILKDIADAKAAIAALEATVGDDTAGLVKDVADLKTDLGALKTELSNLTASFNELKAVVGDENGGLVKDLADLSADFLIVKAIVGDENSGLVKGLNDAVARIDAVEGRLDTLEDEMDAAEGRLDTLEDEMDAAEDRLDDAEGRLDVLEDEMDAAEDRLDDAEGRLDDAEGRLDDAEGRLDDAEGRLDAAESEIERLEEEKATRVELVQAKRELTEKYLTAIDEAKAELNAAIAAGDADLADKIEKLNTALNDAIKAYKDADAALKAELQGEFNGKIDAAKTSLETAIAAVQTNLDTAKSALEAADGALDKKIGDLETALKAADAALAAADETNKTELKAAIESAKTDLQKAIKDGDDKAAADLAAAVEALKAEIAQAEKDARTLPLILAIVAIVGNVALLAWIVVLKRKI